MLVKFLSSYADADGNAFPLGSKHIIADDMFRDKLLSLGTIELCHEQPIAVPATPPLAELEQEPEATEENTKPDTIAN
jgi:hypothetical protein